MLHDFLKSMELWHIRKRQTMQTVLPQQGLHMQQLPVLEYVLCHDGCTQQEVAAALMVSPASIALSTKRLEKAGMLSKTVTDSNLRCKHLTVNERGRAVAAYTREQMNAFHARMLAGFSDEELRVLTDFFNRMTANISDGQPTSDYFLLEDHHG